MDGGQHGAGHRRLAGEPQRRRRDRSLTTARDLVVGRGWAAWPGIRVRMAAAADDRRGPDRARTRSAAGVATVAARPLGAGARPPGPGGAAGTAGADTGAGTRPDPVWPDAGLAV